MSSGRRTTPRRLNSQETGRFLEVLWLQWRRVVQTTEPEVVMKAKPWECSYGISWIKIDFRYDLSTARVASNHRKTSFETQRGLVSDCVGK